MKKNNRIIHRRIAQKVWMSIGILLIAYCATSIQAFVSKGSIQKTFNIIGRESKQSTQNAIMLSSSLTAQVKSYQDAVLAGEFSMLADANTHVETSLFALEEMETLLYNSKGTVNHIRSLKQRIRQYQKDANEVYTLLLTSIDGDESDDLIEQSMVLAQEHRQILTQSAELTQLMSKDFFFTLNRTDQAIEREKWIEIVTFLSSLIILFVLLTYVVKKSITGPIQSIVKNVRDMAEGEGDLTKRVNVTSDDEISSLAKWLNIFVEKLHDIVTEVSGSSKELNVSSIDLTDFSSTSLKIAEEALSKSSSMASSIEEMSVSMASVAGKMSQASENIERIAASTEEMTTTISQIDTDSSKAREISDKAVSKSKQISIKVNELGSAAAGIGEVTNVISNISEQTNLLALNATIEAARAGDAGKGFAVVSNEIKELAKQTAEATSQIRDLIENVQHTTSDTVSEIEQITGIILDINQIVFSIAGAIEEQTTSTIGISESVAKTSKRISEVSASIAQSSEVSEGIAREITEMDLSMNEVGRNSLKVKTSSEQLAGLATQLDSLVGKFKVATQ